MVSQKIGNKICFCENCMFLFTLGKFERQVDVILYLSFAGDRDQNESNSLIDYFKGQFSILNDVSISLSLSLRDWYLIRGKNCRSLITNMLKNTFEDCFL